MIESIEMAIPVQPLMKILPESKHLQLSALQQPTISQNHQKKNIFLYFRVKKIKEKVISTLFM